MEIIKTKIDKAKLYESMDLSLDTCFIDIETTGFSRKNDIIYLVGILYFDKDENSWILAQYFANELKDEPKMLLEASKFILNFKTIINYNGNSFDIPFINHKLKKYRLDIAIDKEKSMDLYAIIRKNKNLLNLENLKLKTIERFLGIYREDIYSGKDCIEFYKDYILTGDPELKGRLLKHNFDDLYFLVDIIEVLDIIRDKKSFTLERITSTVEFTISDISESKDSLTFEGNIWGLEEILIHYDIHFDVIIEQVNNFKIILYTDKGLVSPDKKGVFVSKSDLNLSNDIKSNHGYNIPDDIFLLKVESKYLLDDILKLLREIMREVIE